MLVQVMDKTLSKLATFDEGSMMGSMLGFVVSIVMIPLQKTHVTDMSSFRTRRST